jgi:hypothetical protein
MNKRVFISAAAEDLALRDSLVGEAHRVGAPVQFVDYAVKEAWDNLWRANCRSRIAGCHGLIAIVTPNTPHASRQRWELACAAAEGVAVLLISPSVGEAAAAAPSPAEAPVVPWSWPLIAAFLAGL